MTHLQQQRVIVYWCSLGCTREETGLAQRTLAQCQSSGNALCNRADSAHATSRAAQPGIPRQRRALPLAYRNFERYFATVPSGMHPLGWGGHRTPPHLRAGRLAVRPAGSPPATGWFALPGLLAWGRAAVRILPELDWN